MTKDLCCDIITIIEVRGNYAVRIIASNSTNILPYVVKKQLNLTSIISPPLV